ncbi:DUF3768 domain-containing protein [Tardiphaga sp. P9-11]|uniref:DUF3768 domain-containing protein n=1 Tax=Tardiphaga sp. P9-11 TaxID=2024614 RepID=UPI0011F2229B|nr:DUF3768 domain-containing protein [Tardiphaga sp. P9-11]KAA0070017.1 DUF3768 domain-containing protein [Tardiphaga sp. P9-11]
MSPLPSQIRELNDRLRKNFACRPTAVAGPFKVVITQGVGLLGEQAFAELIAKVECFDAFDENNDPHAEHDFGMIDHHGTRYFWKIDYYDLSMMSGSPAPSDPAVTCRLLTIMRAEEY